MKKRLFTTLLTIATQTLTAQNYAFAEDFAEFKGQDLSPMQQEQMADDLMDWTIVHHAKAEKKCSQKSTRRLNVMVALTMIS